MCIYIYRYTFFCFTIGGDSVYCFFYLRIFHGQFEGLQKFPLVFLQVTDSLVATFKLFSSFLEIILFTQSDFIIPLCEPNCSISIINGLIEIDTVSISAHFSFPHQVI